MITQRKSKTGWRGRLASIATALLLGMGLTGVPLTASHAATVPPAPTGVKAVKRDNSSATVSWNASAGATSYQVEYQSANTSWTWKTETDYKTKTATSFVSTNLVNPPNYKYRVRAVNSAGPSGWTQVNYPATVDPPSAPAGVKAAKRDNSSATVSWNASAGATSYQVEYQSANTSWTWKTETDYKTKTATSFVSTNLVNPPNYKYRVRALNSGGASAWVEVNYPGTVARPPAPTGLKAVKRDNTSATVSWNASAGAASYEVEYQSANTSWAWKTETDYKTKTAVSFVSTNLAASGTYFYRVRAVNSGGSSAWVEVKYPTTVNPPPAPIGLKVTDRTASAVTVSWKASSGAASYQVEYQSAKTSWNWTTDSGYTTKTAVSFVSKNLTAAGTNIYRVRAVNSGGSSAWVQVASVPAAPQGCSQSTTVGTVATCIVKLFDQLWQMPTTRSEASDIQRLENLNRNAQNYDEMIGLLTKLMKLDHDMKAKIISNFR